MEIPAPDIDIERLRLGDARDLAPLISAYNQSLFRGPPGAPDTYYAEQLLQDRTAEVLGARLNGRLVAFVIFYDLPDVWTGMRSGLADHIYVDHQHRRKGIAKAMIEAAEADGSLRPAHAGHRTRSLRKGRRSGRLGELRHPLPRPRSVRALIRRAHRL